METDTHFTFETMYDQRTMTAMAKALRKTARKKRNRRVRAFGWFAVALVLLTSLFPGKQGFVLDFRTGINWVLALVILVILLFEDKINGVIGVKRLPPGMLKSTVTFTPAGYTSSTELGTSQFTYANISIVVEMPQYFVLGFGANHAQIYDKSTLKGGTVEEFRQFLVDVTGKPVQQVT